VEGYHRTLPDKLKDTRQYTAAVDDDGGGGCSRSNKERSAVAEDILSTLTSRGRRSDHVDTFADGVGALVDNRIPSRDPFRSNERCLLALSRV